MSTALPSVDFGLLSKAWAPSIHEINPAHDLNAIQNATHRTLPLLDAKDTASSSVPFICRYRAHIIRPLVPQQVQQIQSMWVQHQALQSLRTKLWQAVTENNVQDASWKEQILTSTVATELQDWYAPYKPPSKGSILERIQQDHPELVQAVVQGFWKDQKKVKLSRLEPRDKVVHLLSCQLVAEPALFQIVLDELSKYCRLTTKLVLDPKADDQTSKQQHHKYETYHQFSQKLTSLKDYQVLAIRRGVDQKALKMTFDIDGAKMEKCLLYHMRNTLASKFPPALFQEWTLLQEAVHDAWTRVWRRKGTQRIWTQTCSEQAQRRAVQVFCDNLKRALLEPPFPVPNEKTLLLALDPGYQAGIKCALLRLDEHAEVVRLETIKYLGTNQRNTAITQLGQLLQKAQQGVKSASANDRDASAPSVLVALGNGHGTQECRALVEEASETSQVPVQIQVVSEAGASVWSVTESAQKEFPNQPPAAIAAVCIGRRLLNPLHELIKIPPKSLGLGMYQHDATDKELELQLKIASVDAVATVGININTCSLEILQAVPGLSEELAKRIIDARPIRRRRDLLGVTGIGPKTFENCAAFCRVSNGPQPLDATLVHPESYELAEWLLKKFSWQLGSEYKEFLRSALPPRHEWATHWNAVTEDAASKFNTSSEQVLGVIQNIVDSILQVDPRIDATQTGGENEKEAVARGPTEECRPLPPQFCNLEQLAKASPVRGILGTVRNIVDFGAFIDLGAEHSGLLHISKLPKDVPLSSLLIGQSIGVDILNVNLSSQRISLSLYGLNHIHMEQQGRALSLLKGAKQKMQAHGQKRSYHSNRKNHSRKKKHKH